MRLGTSINLYSKERGKTKILPYLEATKQCAEAGFKVLDLSMYASVNPKSKDELAEPDWERRIGKLAEESAKLGLEFTQGHAPFNAKLFIYGQQPTEEYVENFKEMTRRSVIAAGMMGVKWLTVHPMTDNINSEFDNDVQKKTNYEFYAPYVELAKKHGVGISIENMAQFKIDLPRKYCCSAEELCDLCDYFADDSVGITWDFGHARKTYNNQSPALERVGKRLKATHVQDNYGKDTDSHLIPFVGGNINWEQIMPTLKKIGYEGDFIFETHHFMMHVPNELRCAAGTLAYDFGTYCLSLADK